MDIANRVGLNAPAQKPSITVGFAVAIAGLTNNPTYGPSAMRGTTLTAQVSGAGGSTPQGATYQWHSAADGPIPGATAASFMLDATLSDMDALSCEVTVPGQGVRTSAPVILREVPPTLQNSLYDEVFDLDTGLHLVAGASAFDGLGLSFSVSGADATVDPATGEISVPTEIEVDGAVITLTATNSGGMASTAFQITVEDLISVEGAIPFGALTPAGAGGVQVTASGIVSGDPLGHWEISNGLLVPSAAGEGALDGLYTLALDNGDTLNVNIERDEASARADEIAAVFDILPETARSLRVRDGDARSVGRQRLSPKVFLNEMVLQPYNWIEDDTLDENGVPRRDPREAYRPVILSGLTIGGDPSNNRVLRMENLTVQGFICQAEQGPTESEANNGIILVERPSRHIIIRQNEIWSRTTADIVAASDYRDNLRTSRQLRGIATKVYSGKNEHICIEENHVHDVSRGMGLVACDSYEGVRSRLCGNIIEDCYTNFFTCGYLDGLDIFDNKCMGVYAANTDTLGAIPATSPHSATGGSFDAGGSRSTANVTMMGNLLHTGWLRTKIHAHLNLSKPQIGATGVKFNDPQASDSYWNIVIGFNTVISHGICMELSGADSDTFIEIFNNTLASESYAGSGSGPVYYFQGANNLRLFNNIGTGYTIGGLDGDGIFSKTLDTLQGYGSVTINSGSSFAGETWYFEGHPVKGLNELTIEEALSAYVPKATTYAALSVQKKGALGTGLYSGNGVHSVTYDPPVLRSGTVANRTEKSWPELVESTGAAVQRDGVTPTAPSAVFAFEGRHHAASDGVETTMISAKSTRWGLYKNSADQLTVRCALGTTNTLEITSSIKVDSSRGRYLGVVSFNMETGRFQVQIDGQTDPFVKVRLWGDDNFSWYSNMTRIGANSVGSSGGNRHNGTMAMLYVSEADLDIETDVGANAFMTMDGPSALSAGAPEVSGEFALIYNAGTPTSFTNTGVAPGAYEPSGLVNYI